jgi:hypothetical protein
MANEGRARHPEPPTWLFDMAGREVSDAQAVILHAANVLPLWPRVKEELAAARPFRNGRRRRIATSRHSWVALGERWQCRRCMAAAFSHENVCRREAEECEGDVRSVRRVILNPRGHNLMIADVDGGPCLLCVACGAWCTTKPKN